MNLRGALPSEPVQVAGLLLAMLYAGWEWGALFLGGTAEAAARSCSIWECVVLVVVDRRLAFAPKVGRVRRKDAHKEREQMPKRGGVSMQTTARQPRCWH